MTDFDYESLPDNTSAATHMIAGAMAGIIEHAAMYPVDAIKTRMQVLNPTPAAVYTGITNAFVRISTTEGLHRLWRGIGSVVLGAGPAHAIHFATYEELKRKLTPAGAESHSIANAVAGAGATVLSEGVMNPFDVVKQRMQVHGSTFKGIAECAHKIYATEGLGAFFISLPTTLLMAVPFQSIQFTTYEFCRRQLNPQGMYDPKTHVLAGGIAGGVAAAITTPLDVIKTLLQTRGTSSDQEIRRCRGLVQACGVIYRRHGVRGFFKGVSPRVIVNFPSTALCWTSYETMKWLIGGEKLALQ
ncbi:uncharacterized protein VTP21DRAFT_4505 [Calcarisporiella thermophila]|uniref:uncharacterized protein n=1 Tax=Calcarisporiella thermophila TaxID=911321 RepID=UPI003742E98F